MLMYRKRTAAIKTEGTPFAYEAVTNAEVERFDDAMLKVIKTSVQRQKSDGTLGSDSSAPAAASTSFTGKNYARGSGASGGAKPSFASVLFPAVGMPSNTTDSFRTSSTQGDWAPFSAALNRDGRRYRGRGFMGDLTINIASGQPIQYDWSFLGGWYADPDDSAQLSAITLETVKPPIFAGASAFTLASSTDFKISKAQIKLNNAPFLRHDANSAGGYLGGWITNILPTITIDPEAVTVGTKDWFANHAAGTESTIIFVAGATALNITTITCTGCQLNANPDEQERNGMAVDALTFQVNGTVTIAHT